MITTIIITALISAALGALAFWLVRNIILKRRGDEIIQGILSAFDILKDQQQCHQGIGVSFHSQWVIQ